MEPKFDGLSKKMFQFFMDICYNNNKPWFEAHRSVFEQEVKAPLYQLANLLAPKVAQIDPDLDVRPQRAVSRIYRDARRSHGIAYRDHMGLCYRPVGKATSESFSIYIYFDTDEGGTAAGFYAPLRERMDAFRHRMLTETEVFDRMARRLDAAGFVVTGEAYRRPLKGDLPLCCQPYYNRKRFSVTRAHPIDDLVFSDRLLPTIVGELDTLAPLVQFVNGREIAPFSALAKGARHE